MRARDSRFVLFLNDHALYNTRYRSGLIDAVTKRGFPARSIGLFDGTKSLITAVIYIAFSSCRVISSNLRANIFFLLFFWRGGLLILNGLGRYRYNRTARSLITLLLKLNPKKQIAVQNYADFRYLRRCNVDRVSWVPGSGGSCRQTSDSDGVFLVSRAVKLKLQCASVFSAMRVLAVDKISVVGVEQESDNDFSSFGLDCVGYVEQDEIFHFGQVFLQPEGYGEGIPHTLVDALCSGLSVIITKRDYLRYGLSEVAVGFTAIKDGWVNLVYEPREVCWFLGEDGVSKRYLELLDVS